MALVNTLHMNSGHGDSSYANNSVLQQNSLRKAIPFLKHKIKGMFDYDIVFDRLFMIADLGCSSGMSTLVVASTIIDMVQKLCEENNRKGPQFQVCLNDLFGNDFNTIFKLLPNFYEKLKKDKGENFGPCFVSAVPGSFYERLFFDESLHFIHSSYSVHWLSQVPEGIENNKLNICIAKTSPMDVLQAYAKQFNTDFTNFLQLRSKELVLGGQMFLTLPGRSLVDPTSYYFCNLWELLAMSLLDMLKEGLVQERDINSFNMPFYIPCVDELRNIIKYEGSFSLDHINVFEVDWDQHDAEYTNMNDFDELSHSHSHSHEKNIVKMIRAIAEPLLVSHFGDSIMDVLFKNYHKHVAEHIAIKAREFSVVISLTRK